MTLLQEVQSLLHGQSEDTLKAIAVLLRSMSPVKSVPIPTGSIIGAAKGEFTLPPDFEEQSLKLDREIAREFYGEC